MSSTTFNPFASTYQRNADFGVNRNVSFDSELVKFKQGANNLARQIISETDNKSYDGPVVIRHHHYHYGPAFYTPFWYREPRVIYADPRAVRYNERQKENESNILLGVLATVVSGIFLYAIGSAIGSYEDATSEANEAESFQMTANFQRSRTNDPQVIRKAQEGAYAANIKARICNRIANSALTNLAMRIAGFSGAALLAVGAFCAAPPLAIAGTVVLVASLGAMLFKWGLNSEDRHNRRDAQLLLDALRNI